MTNMIKFKRKLEKGTYLQVVKPDVFSWFRETPYCCVSTNNFDTFVTHSNSKIREKFCKRYGTEYMKVEFKSRVSKIESLSKDSITINKLSSKHIQQLLSVGFTSIELFSAKEQSLKKCIPITEYLKATRTLDSITVGHIKSKHLWHLLLNSILHIRTSLKISEYFLNSNQKFYWCKFQRLKEINFLKVHEDTGGGEEKILRKVRRNRIYKLIQYCPQLESFFFGSEIQIHTLFTDVNISSDTFIFKMLCGFGVPYFRKGRVAVGCNQDPTFKHAVREMAKRNPTFMEFIFYCDGNRGQYNLQKTEELRNDWRELTPLSYINS